MREPFSEPHDVREQDLLDTLDAIGITAEPIAMSIPGGEGTGYSLKRLGFGSYLYVVDGRVMVEAIVVACVDLQVEPETVFLHLHESRIRGRVGT